MDSATQTNHLKAYGVAFYVLKSGKTVEWLLNYKGGSFAAEYSSSLADLCKTRNVAYSKMSEKDYKSLTSDVKGLKYAGDVIKLTKAPKIAVYTPGNKKQWDDAVTLALTYAEIPYEKVYVNEVLADKLDNYDWLHLHHEDFTGQYGKFWNQFRSAQWYIQDQRQAEELAQKNGYKKVSQMQLAVVKKIKDFIGRGGNLFAMCSGTDTYDIALAAEGTDICETQFDGDPMDADAQNKLDYKKCIAFRNFKISTNPYEYEYSDIDNTNFRFVLANNDYFTINTFPVYPDPVPAMLTQNHTSVINGFMGQTTAFRKEVIKPSITILAENRYISEARMIHGGYGNGTFTFYGGHDPEDYQHAVGDTPTNLASHPNSPGYRLILNNVLLPAANRKAVPVVNCCTDVVKNEAEQLVTGQGKETQITADPSTGDIFIIPATTITFPVNVIISDAAGNELINKTIKEGAIRVNMQDKGAGIFNVRINGNYVGKVKKE